jgi:hypothetical protein
MKIPGTGLASFMFNPAIAAKLAAERSIPWAKSVAASAIIVTARSARNLGFIEKAQGVSARKHGMGYA